MQFSQSGVILGAFTSTYLLEITTYYLHAYYLLLILGAFTSTYLLEKPRITQHMTVRWLGVGVGVGLGVVSHHAAHDGTHNTDHVFYMLTTYHLLPTTY